MERVSGYASCSGQVFEINFRGNIKFDEGFHPPGKRILMHYNCQLSCQCHFTITEMDKHLQKSYDFYKVSKGVAIAYCTFDSTSLV